MTKGKKYFTHIYTNYTNDMRIYLCKYAETTNGDLTTTYCSVKNMAYTIKRVEGKVLWTIFSVPTLFHDLETSKISATMTIQPNQKDVPHDFSTEKKTETEKV